MEEIEIPRYVDSQPQLFFWEIDEAVIFVGLLGCGITVGGYATLISMGIGYYVVRLFRRFKDGALDGILLHLCYWMGIMSLNKHYEDSVNKDFFL